MHTHSLKFRIICSIQSSININTVEFDPHSDSLQNVIVKPKNRVTLDVLSWVNLAKTQKPRYDVTFHEDLA